MITLAFACAHVAPGQDLSRFYDLGRLILKRKPDNIISLGDFVTVDSLTHWDQNKRLVLEGRRYNEDIETGWVALHGIFSGLQDMRDRQREQKKAMYTPRIIWMLGNHEDRVRRYVEMHPEMQGYLDVQRDLNLESRIDLDVETVPYKEFADIEGVKFTHAVINEANQPIAGKYAVKNAADRIGSSLIFGHTHRFETMSVQRHGAGMIQVASIGTFSEEIPSYAQGGLNHYWQGCVLVHHVGYGKFDLETYSIERLRNER